jgi:hypothetical protein
MCWRGEVKPAPIVFTARWVAPRSRHARAALDTHVGRIAARLADVAVQTVEHGACLVGGLELREPPIGDAGQTL